LGQRRGGKWHAQNFGYKVVGHEIREKRFYKRGRPLLLHCYKKPKIDQISYERTVRKNLRGTPRRTYKHIKEKMGHSIFVRVTGLEQVEKH